MSELVRPSEDLPEGYFFCTENGEKAGIRESEGKYVFVLEDAPKSYFGIFLTAEQYADLKRKKVESTQEIERKFLVKHLPADIEKFPRTYIEQCYLIIGNNDEVRIREKRKGEKQSYSLTIKSGNGAVRGEYETTITQEQYEKLKVLQEGNAIKKYRINIPQGERTIELDIYLDELSGNSTAEVEFPSEEMMQGFEQPDWFGKDVSEVKSLKNKQLAKHGFPTGLYSRLQVDEVRHLAETILEG